MRFVVLSLALLLVLPTWPAKADDVTLRREIIAAFEAITLAFEQQDRAAIKALTTPDHIAITPYYGGAKDIDYQLETAKDLIFTQKPISELRIEAIGPTAALLYFVAEMGGSYKGKPLAPRAGVTLIFQKEDGKWLEHVYQETPLD